MNQSIVIGDIHGAYRALLLFIKKPNVTVADTLLFLGDLVDGWSQSYKVIEGTKYCVKESLIPLNSCGEQSDWPCMDPEGCLGITQFIKE